MSDQIYLSRRNLLMLLAKLDRNLETPGASACTVVKYRNEGDPFVQTMDTCKVTAVEDDAFYAKRNAGPMHPSDEVTVATKIYSAVMEEKPDVHTRDAPTPDATLGLEVRPLCFVGRAHGEQVRQLYDLAGVDADPSRKFTLEVLETVYSVSSSFFLGMFEESIVSAGSSEKFFEKFKFNMSNRFDQVLQGCVTRALQNASLSPRA